MEDDKLLAKLSNRDMIVQNSMYPLSCLSTLYQKLAIKQTYDEVIDGGRYVHRTIFAELV